MIMVYANYFYHIFFIIINRVIIALERKLSSNKEEYFEIFKHTL